MGNWGPQHCGCAGEEHRVGKLLQAGNHKKAIGQCLRWSASFSGSCSKADDNAGKDGWHAREDVFGLLEAGRF